MNTLPGRARRLTVVLTLLAVSAIVVPNVISNLQTVQKARAADAKRSRGHRSPLSFTDDGQLLQPRGYRRWVYVGTPLTPNDMNGGQAAFPEFHAVYINPEAFAAYEATGEFPNGTVLVKELVSVATKSATSGKGYFMGEFTGLEVAVKDQTRFQSEPGNWAYFSFGHELPLAEQVGRQAVASCSTCHGASADQDYVFTQYYPVLRAAKPAK